MRKLEYLRKAMRKCKTMEDAERIKLPKEFRASNDATDYPKLSVDLIKKEDGYLYMQFTIIHGRLVKPLNDGIFGLFSRSYEKYNIPISKRFNLKSYIPFKRYKRLEEQNSNVGYSIMRMRPAPFSFSDFLENYLNAFPDEEIKRTMKDFYSSKNFQ